VIGHADVFVEMEEDDLRPVDARLGHQCGQHLELGGAGGNDHVGLADGGDCVANDGRTDGGGALAELGFRRGNIDLYHTCDSMVRSLWNPSQG